LKNRILVGFLLFLALPVILFNAKIFGAVLVGTYIILLGEIHLSLVNKHGNFSRTNKTALIYSLLLIPSLVCAYYLRVHFFEGLILILLGTAINDIAPYFIGKKFGKTPFFQSVSPNKTQEGAIAGLTTTFIFFAVVSAAFWSYNASILFLWVLIVIFGTLGDLLASKFKRINNVKDFSNLLGEHGGLLDRIDSHLATIPVSFLYFWIAGFIKPF